jgi:hypothetical protein
MPILQQKIVDLNNEIDIFDTMDYDSANPGRAVLKPFQPTKVQTNEDDEDVTVDAGPYKYNLPNGTTWEDFQVEFPYGPQNLKFDQYAGVTKKIPRPGKAPLLVFENPDLRTVTFSATIADKVTGGCDPFPVIEILDKIELIAANAIPCKFVYGVSGVPYAVTITKFSFTTNRRNLDGNPTQVSVDLQLTETPLYDQQILELEAITFTPDPAVIGSAPPPDEIDELVISTTSNADFVNNSSTITYVIPAEGS